MQKRLDLVRGELRASLLYNADRAGGLSELGHMAALDGKASEAQRWFRAAIELEPTFAGAYLNLADFHRAGGNDAEALRLLEQGLKRAEEKAPLEHALGLAQVRAGKKAEALAHLSRAVQLAPDEPRFGFVYAVALHDTGKISESIALLERLHTRFAADVQIERALVGFKKEAASSKL
jgi:Flp pilus assembly protein TadD